MKYYTIHFTATTGGAVQVLAKNKRDAWKILSDCDYVSAQVEDQVPDASDMRIVFDRKSIELDTEQEPCCEGVPALPQPLEAASVEKPYDPTNLINLIGRPGIKIREIKEYLDREEIQLHCEHDWGHAGGHTDVCLKCDKVQSEEESEALRRQTYCRHKWAAGVGAKPASAFVCKKCGATKGITGVKKS